MRLIDADALIQELRKGTIITDDLYGMGIMVGNDHAMKKINSAPTIEAEPVRHGRWVKAKHKKDYWGIDSDGDFGCWGDYPVLCSSCKYDATENSTGKTNYCPNCGAKMDLEERA